MTQEKKTEVIVKKDTRFKKGQSGNPAGRPKGSKNRTTLIKQAIEGQLVEELSQEAVVVMKKAIEMAKKGDQAMIKLVIERVLPLRRATDDDDRHATPAVNIVVNTLTGKDEGNIIEGEVEDE